MVEEKIGKEEEETSQTKKMTDSCENKSDARRSKTNTKRIDRDTHTHARTHSMSKDGCANTDWSCGGRKHHTPCWRHAGLLSAN